MKRGSGARAALGRHAGVTLGLVLVTLATRAPWVGRSLGEADCARYLLGLGQWLRQGPGSPGIYAKVLSPGYYAAAAFVLAHSRLPRLTVLDGASLLAALASAPLLYFCGRRLTTPRLAGWAALLFLLSPAFWWLGLEAHPQGPSFLFFLVAFACFLQAWRPRAGPPRRFPAPFWSLTMMLAFGVGLLLKNDFVLQAGIFPATAWARAPHRRPAERRRRVLLSLLLTAGGAGLFWLGRRWLLGLPDAAIERSTYHAVAEFWGWPRGTETLKQLLPLATAPGLATGVLVAVGCGLGLARREWRRRWLPLLAAAAVPGPLFWILLRGNNARHLAPFLLLPLWAALEAVWGGRARPRLGVSLACLSVMALNFLVIPASSNTTLYPSGNVAASQAMLAARTREMNDWLRQQFAAASPPACLVGNYTLPYLELDWLEGRAGAAAAKRAGSASLVYVNAIPGLVTVSAGGMRFVEVNSSAEYERARADCARPASLEYDRAGRHRQFFGQEWRTIPWQKRWYPADPAVIH